MLFFISDFLYAIFIKECIFTFENFFSANSQNFSIGCMKNPRSFLFSNRGRRTRFHFEFLDWKSGRQKSLRISPRSESYQQSFAEVQSQHFLTWSRDLGYFDTSDFFREFSSESHRILFLGQLLGVFSVGNSGLTIFQG